MESTDVHRLHLWQTRPARPRFKKGARIRVIRPAKISTLALAFSRFKNVRFCDARVTVQLSGTIGDLTDLFLVQQLLQITVLHLGFLQDGNVGVSVSSEC